MSDNKLPAADPAARELIAAVRTLVSQIAVDAIRVQMQGSEADKGLHAQAVLENLLGRSLRPLVAAHDALASALNATSPGAPPILSLTKERPA
jgi:hypothetical protein